MTAMAVVMPVLPGKEDAARAFASAVAGPRLDEFAEFQVTAGNTTRETWHLVGTPDGGSLLAVWFEAENPDVVFAELATAEGDFAEWFRTQIQEITGADMSQPGAEPTIEQLLDWQA